jgi:hypothetical protein
MCVFARPNGGMVESYSCYVRTRSSEPPGWRPGAQLCLEELRLLVPTQYALAARALDEVERAPVSPGDVLQTRRLTVPAMAGVQLTVEITKPVAGLNQVVAIHGDGLGR